MAAFVEYNNRNWNFFRHTTQFPQISSCRSLDPYNKQMSNIITLRTNGCGCDGILYYNISKIKRDFNDRIAYYTLPPLRKNIRDNYWILLFDLYSTPINIGDGSLITGGATPKLNCVCAENANFKCRQKDIDMGNGRHMSHCVSEGDCARCFAESVIWGVPITSPNWNNLSIHSISYGGIFVQAKQVIKTSNETP